MKTPVKKLCPGQNAFVGAIMGELSKSELESFLGHVSRCPECQLKFSALEELEAELEAKKSMIPEAGLSAAGARALRKLGGERLGELSGKRRLSIPAALRMPAAALAAGLVLVLLGSLFILRRPSANEIFRGKFNQELRLLEPSERLKAAPLVFRWTDVQGKDNFYLKIIDDELNTILSVDLTETHFRLPAEVREKLKPGTTYLWTVEAWDEDNNVLAVASRYFEIE